MCCLSLGMICKVEEVFEKKNSVCVSWDMHSASDLGICLGGINGNVCRHNDDFDEVHEWYGVGKRKEECH